MIAGSLKLFLMERFMNATAARAPNSALPQILTKITSRDMGIVLPRLDVSVDFEDQPGVTDPAKKKRRDELIAKWADVYTVGGLLVATKTVKGKEDKEGVRFIGQFKAQLAEHLGAKWFASSRCHLPTAGEELLFSSFTIARQEDPNSKVQFLFKVGIQPPKPGKPSMTGYEWTVHPLVDLSEAQDPVQALFERARPAPQLAGPTLPHATSAEPAPSVGDVPAGDPSSTPKGANRRGASA
jgi:hypothetical protein